MKILTIRTDKPEAEIGLFDGGSEIKYTKWQADRQLAEELNQKIGTLLAEAKINLESLDAIVAYKGPGSFTGLRIGLAAANALAFGLNRPVVSTDGDSWIKKGIERIENGEDEKVAIPDYGGEARITKPKK